ncbi:DUF2889 domain-containing protein [Pseudoduganella plicata]|uniref:DUF2889 domain-containing protein n=1 Tax=Pseudoduganella plicata TaxID=321984 RepID=A0A4P7BEC7_9BURK|nr:DUF2889 domain-containing protein [Pseudoduganella plicata]QBQ37061.1 DUF2889 domain-containing protein [Pseudoduganella plicata]GGY99682.1 hypothetical protein GCM10007388_36690 [Pseudoduganella plicata]
MSLSNPVSRRALRHTRAIDIQAFAREDGLWDLDAHITDIKENDTLLASGLRPGGQPLHDLSLRITVDRQLTIVDAEAVSDAVPYAGYCDIIGPAYKALIGLNLMRGFRHELKARLAGIAGCTHLTELAQILPTAAVQAFANDVWPTYDAATAAQPKEKPFQLDKCHALRTDGGAVAEFYPRWVAKAANTAQVRTTETAVPSTPQDH